MWFNIYLKTFIYFLFGGYTTRGPTKYNCIIYLHCAYDDMYDINISLYMENIGLKIL